MSPEVFSTSVLIPYHNEREMLHECLVSLQRQTLPVEEILIYDDASSYPAMDYVPANTATLVRGDRNVGPSRGRNILLAKAQGNLVHFHDADDWFDPYWHESVRERFATSNTEVVFTGLRCVLQCDPGDAPVPGVDLPALRQDLLSAAIRSPIVVPAGTYRRELVQRIGGYRDMKVQAEDFDFHVRLAAQFPRYELLDDPLVVVRVRAGSRSKQLCECWCDVVRLLELLVTDMPRSYHGELAERAIEAASALYRLGAKEEGLKAARLARRIAPVQYRNYGRVNRILYRVFSFGFAEELGVWYRRIIPQPIRSIMVKYH